MPWSSVLSCRMLSCHVMSHMCELSLKPSLHMCDMTRHHATRHDRGPRQFRGVQLINYQAFNKRIMVLLMKITVTRDRTFLLENQVRFLWTLFSLAVFLILLLRHMTKIASRAIFGTSAFCRDDKTLSCCTCVN